MKTVSNEEMVRYLCHYVRNHGKADLDEMCYAVVVIASEPLSGGSCPILVSLYYGPDKTELRSIPINMLHERENLSPINYDVVLVDNESYYPERNVSESLLPRFKMAYLATAGL